MAHGGGSGDDVRRIATVGVVVAILAAAIQSSLYAVDVHAFDRSVLVLDLEEGALVTWAASSAAFAVGLLALLVSFLDESQRLQGRAIAAGMAFISFDDALYLHERIGYRVTDKFELADTYVQLVWPSLYFPFLVALALLLARLARQTRTAQHLIGAGLVVLASAVVLEIAAVALDRTGLDADSWLGTAWLALEEGLELAGWIVIATGAAVRLLVLARTRDPEPPA